VPKLPLKIIEVDTGISGLTAAIALGREGRLVELYEKSSFRPEIGAAFHLALK
jgi:salicylate hydroxylase